MSGPWPDSTEVWIFVSSSLGEANVSNVTVAPVCALNLADTSVNHCFCWSG